MSIDNKLQTAFSKRPAARRRHSGAGTYIARRPGNARLVVVMDTTDLGKANFFQVLWEAK